uniref:Uncharacterized protein n=1 Tax=Glossina austeni TaxID=7395 RepID=A0A1A9V1Q4_GLOAU
MEFSLKAFQLFGYYRRNYEQCWKSVAHDWTNGDLFVATTTDYFLYYMKLFLITHEMRVRNMTDMRFVFCSTDLPFSFTMLFTLTLYKKVSGQNNLLVSSDTLIPGLGPEFLAKVPYEFSNMPSYVH